MDAEEKINAFVAVLDGMIGSGLVTLEKVKVLQYGNGARPRCPDSPLKHSHMSEVYALNTKDTVLSDQLYVRDGEVALPSHGCLSPCTEAR